MSKTIKPIGTKVAFRIVERVVNEFDENGLVAPTKEEYHEKLIVTGVVVAVGSDVKSIAVNDEIILNIASSVDIKPTGHNVKIIAEDEIIAVVA